MRKLYATRTPLYLAVTMASLSASPLWAAGFAINENSVSGMGTAYAGRAADATDDVTTIYGNPAGLSRLTRPEISGGITFIHVKSDISNARGSLGVDSPSPVAPNILPHIKSSKSISGTTDGDFVPNAYIPNFYWGTPVNDRWAVGLGIYAPFGVTGKYEKSFIGRYLAQDTELQIVNVQPTFSYKINSRWSVGAGIYASYANGSLSQNVPTLSAVNGHLLPRPHIDAEFGPDAKSEVDGSGWGYGYNIGVLFQATDKTRLGLTYHSKVNYTLKGHIKQSGFPDKINVDVFGIPVTSLAMDANGKYKGELELNTPESVDLAIVHDLTDRWTLMAGATWTRWSRFENIDIKADEKFNGPAPGVIIQPGQTYDYVPENWHNSWSYSIGAAYKLNPKWTLRAGYAWDESPIPSQYQSARIPSGNRTWVTVGAKYDATQNFSIDMALGYLVEDHVKVHDELYDPNTKKPSTLISTSYDAEYNNKAIGAGLQLTYKF